MAAAIDAVRDVARRFGASRPDPGAPTTLVRLSTAVHPSSPDGADEMAEQAAPLCLRLPAPDEPTEHAVGVRTPLVDDGEPARGCSAASRSGYALAKAVQSRSRFPVGGPRARLPPAAAAFTG